MSRGCLAARVGWGDPVFTGQEAEAPWRKSLGRMPGFWEWDSLGGLEEMQGQGILC